MQLVKPIVLIGMMGSGKSAVGKALAARLDVPFADSDAEIEKAANMTIAEIFERDGEAFFRTAEARVIDRLLSDKPQILATGGGAFMTDTVRGIIQEKSVSVFLDADLDTVWARVRHSKTRPLLQVKKPKAKIKQLLATRRPVYLGADLVVETKTAYSIADTTQKVIDALITHKALKDTAP
ncbi:MAG: shikimate kinase [Planktomarina sp.]